MRLNSKTMASALIALGVGFGLHAERGEAAAAAGTNLGKTSQQTGPWLQAVQLAQAQQATSPLPGGASSLSETYEDWQVSCVHQGGAKRCALSQSQTQQAGQRVLTIEIGAPVANKATGIVVLPFGLALSSGAVLQINDKPAGQPLPFRTCLPVGCVVPVSFEAPTLALLRGGGALKIKAVADGGQDAPFSISLKGFAAALDRVAALSKL
ncbi:invasion associated locus B family protein [Rhodopseudomonas sp. P2A-2r]|uniref:invasion associated locus B family protein n=1 Tax=unclassified Rhodopseudomonas TaxID=2638247 RepID=UPI002234A72B|nr:invasion associated locus B family protein [Rhodopseudomonas sp. P2A-2r]UZE49090.1 invasion associated locus B family protein [Rhodopseudomonas sp. P2A-2r]